MRCDLREVATASMFPRRVDRNATAIFERFRSVSTQIEEKYCGDPS
jgi:hypothetical protein